MIDPIERFRSEMRRKGLEYGGPILADGALHRIKAGEDRGRDSWYVLFSDGIYAGAYGSWRDSSIWEQWREKEPKDLSDSEWKKVQKRLILAADNDQWNTRNSGLLEAKAAAESIRGRLAVPSFAEPPLQ